jgi:hypothetical protein
LLNRTHGIILQCFSSIFHVYNNEFITVRKGNGFFFQTPTYIVHIHEATGQLNVKNGITLYIAKDELRDAVGSNLYTDKGSTVIQNTWYNSAVFFKHFSCIQ